MTGVLNAVVGNGGGEWISVTLADINSLGSAFGYNDSASPGGSISPTTFRGIAIRVISNNTSTSPDQFTLTLSGSRAANFLGGIQVQKSDGTTSILYADDATHSDLTSVTAWTWEVNGIWTAATPSPRSVRIFL